ncbi:MAG: EAL domain-containing protein [Burkholderiaceae bacterium]|nr:EAL domain-containing protein [Burkholderiaceae bacterium]
MSSPEPAGPAPSPVMGGGTVLRGLLPDYNRAAAAYWWLLAVAGALALVMALGELADEPSQTAWQVVFGSMIAAIVGMFPLRIPKTKNSIAAGDIFIFLLLLVHGPHAAVIAATAEAAACAWRTSGRWSSRIAGPAAAASSMLACGTAFHWAMAALGRAGVAGDGVSFGAILVFAGAYFVVGPTVVTTVIYLKRWRAPNVGEWLTTFGWLGMGYLASASVAGVLFIAFRRFGLHTVLIAVPMIGMFVTSLRMYFAQQEATEREAAELASRQRAEHAEREAAMAARHLEELAISDRRFQSAFAHAAIGMALVSRQGRLVQVNASMSALFGRPEADLVGAALLDLVDARDRPLLQEQIRRLRAAEPGCLQCELRCRHAQGREVWASIHGSAFAGDDPGGEHLIIQAFDVTARRLAEGRLQHLALHDSLTNLPNRSQLGERLAQAISAGRSDPARQFSLLHLRFERFQLLSDSLGRGVGDRFLIAIAKRIQAQLRPSDLLARLAGDDFGILALHDGGGAQRATALASRLQQAFATPVLIDDTEVQTGARIGITVGDAGYTSAEEALRDAQLAAALARRSDAEHFAVFDPSLHERAAEQLLLETELRRALDAGQLALAFQPVFSIAERRVVGFEALARWPSSTRGMVRPDEFIPVAEASGLIVPLTRWALQTACRALRQWRALPGVAGELFVNVNIAGRDLCDAGFADFVRDTIASSGLPTRCLTLEITETTLMQHLETGKRTLARLRDLGVGLSVDDFGTGYSSLSHLSKLPISSLKIDRSFVAQLDGASVETEIVRAVIQLGHALGKRVIAEGIETEDQLEWLRALGCGHAQGFLLGRPQGSEQVAALLSEAPLGAEAGRAPGFAPTARVATVPPSHPRRSDRVACSGPIEAR